MSKYKRGESREKYTFMPKCLEEYIEKDNIVRAIDKIVDSFDMEAMKFKHTKPTGKGRTPYDPRDMLKLYIYGYLNGYRSTRKLERECKRNIELKWLINNLTPHNKTISNFRHDNLESFTYAFTQFLYICNQAKLIGKQIIAVDGSKIRANNGKNKYFTKNKIKKMIEHYQEKVKTYLEELDSEDEKEATEKVAAAEQRIEELEEILEEIKKNGAIALMDPDAKMMKQSNNGLDVAHNAQIAVDEKNNIVVASEVLSERTDAGNLTTMVEKTIATFEQIATDEENKKESNDEGNNKKKIKILADKGYYQGKDLEECEKIAETYVPRPTSPKKAYGKDNFIYNKQDNTYTCPEGQVLTCHSGADVEPKLYYNQEACKQCKNRELCTTSKAGYRVVAQRYYEDALQTIDERTANNLELYRKRKTIVEPVFGIIKRAFGFTYFLTRGNKRVKAELDLCLLSYNILRAKNVLGTQGLIEAVDSLSSFIFGFVKGYLAKFAKYPLLLFC